MTHHQQGNYPHRFGFALWLSTLAACGGSTEMPVQQLVAGANAYDAGSGSMAGRGGNAAGAASDAYTHPTTNADARWCDVQQTLHARCTACHDGNHSAGAPMPLLSYADLQAPSVSDPSRKVYELVGERVHDAARPMPPQQPLTAAELADIDAWIAAAAPAGDDPECQGSPVAQPQPAAWPDHCDAVYKLLAHGPAGTNEPLLVPAGQEIHPKISVPAPWGAQALQAIAFRSVTDNRKVLHHWILYGPNREFLVGWAPGKDATPLPENVGMNLAGGTLTLDMHYNNLFGDRDEPDNSGVEICALTQEHFRRYTGAVHTGFAQYVFSIPAHATHYAVTGRCKATTTAPVSLFTASPHAHTLGRHVTFSVQKASGETVVMYDAAFDFDEQGSYLLTPPVQIETGDTVITTCIYDNPTDHAVRFGENTEDEMCFNFAAYYPMGALSCGLSFGR